jgi:hypothetical protein
MSMKGVLDIDPTKNSMPVAQYSESLADVLV